jgi:Fe-S-cluster-containing dehydrogenase component/anaerobic selenocysteine-containing dehydrogenase
MPATSKRHMIQKKQWQSRLRQLPTDGISRRRFLNMLSASAALAFGTTSCSKIDRGKIVPYTKRPEEILPGRALYYASTFHEGLFTHSVLIKTREGRPLHLEGNPESSLFRGKTSLRALGDILGLYDPDRLRAPSAGGRPSTWQLADLELTRILQDAQKTGKPVLLLTDAVLSPTRRSLIEELKKAVPNLRHVSWEPAASQTEILAAQSAFGEALLPQIHLNRADVILSLQSDFLGSDGNAPQLIRDFAQRRKISKSTDHINRLWVVEGCMSLTGANADERLLVRPSQIAPLAFALARHLHESCGIPLPSEIGPDVLQPFDLARMAESLRIKPALLKALCGDLKRAGKAALILTGSQLHGEAHMAGHLLNTMLGVEGTTIDRSLSIPAPELMTYSAFQNLLNDAANGEFTAAIFWGANPAYTFPNVSLWKKAIPQIPRTVRIGLYEDETALDCQWRLPENHWLESWGDFEPSADLLTLRQPVIGTIHNSKQGEDILLSCLRALGKNVPANYHDYLKDRWRRAVYPSDSPVEFGNYWNVALHNGVLQRTAQPRPASLLNPASVIASAQSAIQTTKPSRMEAVLLPGAGVYDGRYANNGWLNELPDPVTKTTWGNPLLLSIHDASELGVKDQDLVTITAGTATIEVPVLVQPGQAPGVVSLALGYGRQTGAVAANIGVNAYRLINATSTAPQLRTDIVIARASGSRTIPKTQRQYRLDGRENAHAWTMAEYARKPEEKVPHHASLIPDLKFPEHKWEMTVDMSACVGCSACVIACQSENNISVVGPERIAEGREMHWIRIDRYYEGNPKSPSTIHQPVFCQHCDNAPCETVCPVNATTHSPDGLNQMAYNRCVGTRYCSNNCPFKVRRFNFFEYTAFKKAPENFVYNPDVSVRPRGVMEKCTFCIQRIQDAKRRAKVEERRITDGEITPACAAACPAEAIVFGDANDPNSRVSKLKHNDRSYHMLEELGIKPSVTYLADISNPVTGKSEA